MARRPTQREEMRAIVVVVDMTWRGLPISKRRIPNAIQPAVISGAAPTDRRDRWPESGNCSWLLNTHVLARHHRPPYRTSPSSQKRRLGSCGGTRTGFDGRQKGVSPKKGRHGENFGGAGRRHMTCRGLPPRRRQPKYVSSQKNDAQERSYHLFTGTILPIVFTGRSLLGVASGRSASFSLRPKPSGERGEASFGAIGTNSGPEGASCLTC